MKLVVAREARQRLIDENPSNISVERRAVTSDGFGGSVEDPSGAVVLVQLKVRISHVRSGPGYDVPVPPGLSSNLGRYILSDYWNVIQKGDEFTAIGKRWRVGTVDTIYMFNGIIGYRAELIEAVSVGVST